MSFRAKHIFLLLLTLFLSIGCKDSATGQDEPEAAEAIKAEESETEKANQKTNRLINETSPYLLTHAHNPVDWYPWGDEAFKKAKDEGKLIFLSVGYSSCHWCHVMERESFMDDEIAEFLNEHFVCIKVDREERPDVDQIYMAAIQALSGRGGWPMSVFMTGEAKPFFGGSYFPARDGDREGLPGFLTLIKRIDDVWTDQPELLERDAERLTEFVKNRLDGRAPQSLTPLGSDLLRDVRDALAERFDPQHGGFGFNPTNPMQPKFPEPSNFEFLMFWIEMQQDDDVDVEPELQMLTHSLDKMAMGGIRDHLGGGFHRYSVDRFWAIPHFEKMLYDNGQLASVYSTAYALTGNDRYREVVEELLRFVELEMTDDGGAFYSALDADSEHVEGKYYRWTQEEVKEILNDEQYELFADVYGIDLDPNFEEEFYALLLPNHWSDLVKRLEPWDSLNKKLAPMRAALLEHRSKRVRPLMDDKILTGWNGLMIRGFADSGRLLEQDKYTQMAARAADFCLDNLKDNNGNLLRTYSQGKAKLNAYLDDYAFLIEGLIALHKATGDEKWLTSADGLMKTQLERFWDTRSGGFYFTANDHESLLARGKNPVDGARPSGNSTSALNLIYLSKQLDNKEYLDFARRTVQSVSGIIKNSPTASPRTAIAVELLGEQ
ncbi:MAG: thioredoxin domain-containing protein [Pirellulaceae bacterium]